MRPRNEVRTKPERVRVVAKRFNALQQSQDLLKTRNEVHDGSTRLYGRFWDVAPGVPLKGIAQEKRPTCR